MKNASQYRIDDADESRVSSHVGHKVEITGTVEGQSGATTGTSGTSSAAGTSSSSSSSMASNNSPKLKVESIRMIASSCSQ